MNSKTLVVIAGPTGSGKTDLGIAVAEHFGVPVISADSRQIFREMPVGTAQPTAEQLVRVKHYFVATHDVTESYTSGRYEREALELLAELFQDSDITLAVGGSGLYIDALCNGLDAIPKGSPALREELIRRLGTQGIGNLLEELRERDPEYYEKVDHGNPNRLIRALEVCIQSGKPYSSLRNRETKPRDFDIIKIGTLVDRPTLYQRINRRVDMMMEAGLEEEARRLYPLRHLNALQTVGYREMFEYFDGKTSLGEAVELIKRNSRRYAKRQMTWFGRDEKTTWLDPLHPEAVIAHIENLIS